MKQRVNILTIIFISFLLCLFIAGSALSECPPDAGGGGGGGGGGTENSSSSNGTGGGSGPFGGSGSPGGSGSDGGSSSATGNHNYDPSWGLKYAIGNPTEIAPGGTAEISINGGHPNFRWRITGEGLVFVANGGTEIETDSQTLTVQASSEIACETAVTIEVTDVNGEIDSGVISIPPSGNLEWDHPGSADTISANGTATIALVEEGGGPYTWTVTGGSAYFNAAHTLSSIETTSNTTTLYAYNACGVISIKVQDACGLETDGQVRAPGKWVACGEQDCNDGWNPQSWGYIYPVPGAGYRIEKFCTAYNSADHRPCTISCGGYTYTAPGNICQPYPNRTCGILKMQIWVCP